MKRMMIEIGIKGFIVKLDIENHDEVLIVLRVFSTEMITVLMVLKPLLHGS